MSPERLEKLCIDTNAWIAAHPSAALPRRLRGAWKIWKNEHKREECKKILAFVGKKIAEDLKKKTA